MPAPQSTTPDYYAKGNCVTARITADDLITQFPAWVDDATIVLRRQGTVTAIEVAGVITGGGSPSGMYVELNTTLATLGPGLYDVEWLIEGSAEAMRIPADRYLLLEIVEALS